MDRASIICNAELFDTFASGDAAQRSFHKSVTKNGKKFLVVVRSSTFLFVPGHYAIVPSNQLAQLQQKQTVPSSEVENCLDSLFGKAFAPGEPLYDALDAAYLAYCTASCTAPSQHHQARTYWLARATA